jgi:hypothetical protein
MLGEAAGFLTSPCLPKQFLSYGGWTGTMTLLGMLCANASQLCLTDRQAAPLETKPSSDSQAKTALYIIEVGVAVHSILIGLTLGILSGEVTFF